MENLDIFILIKKIYRKIAKIYNSLYCKLFKTNYPLLNRYLRKKLINEGYNGVIYMLHRVDLYDSKGLPPNECLKVTPKALQKIIDQYRKSGFDFLSLDDIYIHTIQNIPFKRPFVSFTLDDGYKDNYQNAYTIFKKNNIPFCIYIATDFIDKKAILWWYSIEDLINQNTCITFNGQQISCITKQEKWDAFRIMREYILSLNQKNLNEELENTFAAFDINWHTPILKYGMNWEQINEMSKDPLCTIGCHTKSHASIQYLSKDEIMNELKEANDIISKHIGTNVIHFSLPYGRESKINLDKEFESCGFRTIAYANVGPYNLKSIHKKGKIIYIPRKMLL